MLDNKITFKGALGEDLAARLDAPDNPKAFMLFAHCFTGTKDLNAVNRISRALNDEGIALFRFDFTGLGGSGGDFANTNFSSNVQDIIAAADFMREQYEAPKIIAGHSFGGTAVLAAASSIPEVKAVATIGSPADTEHVIHNFEDKVEQIKREGKADVMLAGRPFTIKKQFLEDLENQKMRAHISGLNRALLVMHSPGDDTVKIYNAKKIYEQAQHPKSFVSLDDADHLLMDNPADAEYVAKILTAWASRYINYK